MPLGVVHGLLRTIPGDHTLSLKEQSQTTLLTATDAGTGIPEDALLHLFEEFDRAQCRSPRETGDRSGTRHQEKHR